MESILDIKSSKDGDIILLSNGKVVVIGTNTNGRLCLNPSTKSIKTFTLISNLPAISSIALQEDSSCIILEDGRVLVSTTKKKERDVGFMKHVSRLCNAQKVVAFSDTSYGILHNNGILSILMYKNESVDVCYYSDVNYIIKDIFNTGYPNNLCVITTDKKMIIYSDVGQGIRCDQDYEENDCCKYIVTRHHNFFHRYNGSVAYNSGHETKHLLFNENILNISSHMDNVLFLDKEGNIHTLANEGYETENGQLETKLLDSVSDIHSIYSGNYNSWIYTNDGELYLYGIVQPHQNKIAKNSLKLNLINL